MSSDDLSSFQNNNAPFQDNSSFQDNNASFQNNSPLLNNPTSTSTYCYTSTKYSCSSCHRTFHQLKLNSLQVECPRCGSIAYEVSEDNISTQSTASMSLDEPTTIEEEEGSWEDIPEENQPSNSQEETAGFTPIMIFLRDNVIILVLDPAMLASLGLDPSSQDYQALIEAFLSNDPNKYGPAPAEEEAIKKLEELDFCKDKEMEKAVSCTVCQEEYQDNEKLVRLPCDHYYHKDCVVEWLSRHNACPMCRKAI